MYLTLDTIIHVLWTSGIASVVPAVAEDAFGLQEEQSNTLLTVQCPFASLNKTYSKEK